jgi:benzoate-CoA ligase
VQLAGASEHAVVAAEIGIPAQFNAASYFVDRHLEEGRGEKVAIECGEQSVTYAQVAERCNRIASALRSQLGVRMEERIALLLLDGPEFVYSFFGAIKIGAVPIPTNTLLRPADYTYMLNDARVRVVIVSEALLPVLRAIPRSELRYLEHVVVVGGSAETGDATSLGFDRLLARGTPELEPAPTSRDDAAFWLYSSGSTGFPKGCVHLQHDMVMCAELYARPVLQLTERDRCFSVAKLFFAYGLGNGLYFPFAVGATAILLVGPPTAENVLKTVERHRPTLFFSVPTNYGQLLAQQSPTGRPDYDFSSVRWGVSAGEALPPSLFDRFRQRFGVTILDGIGSTEICHIFISNQRGAVRPGSTGKEVAGYLARIVDEDAEPVAQGEIGNLLVQGDSTCAGYWNQHEKTKDTFDGRWVRTGDKYYQDSDGYFWYAGRGDDMLKVGGIWVSPVEVENALMQHSAVQEAAVIGCADEHQLIKPKAYVQLLAGTAGTPELAIELQTFVRERLADYKRPRWVEFVDQLPKTATGKTQRFKLREESAREAAAPR